ncbi:hypothetical protein H1235_17245 [Pseudoxanthomonas sp. NC8]|nr:hypothetical protein H1235_17245 [Pseudoxanthomonas sp. NC8]
MAPRARALASRSSFRAACSCAKALRLLAQLLAQLFNPRGLPVDLALQRIQPGFRRIRGREGAGRGFLRAGLCARQQTHADDGASGVAASGDFRFMSFSFGGVLLRLERCIRGVWNAGQRVAERAKGVDPWSTPNAPVPTSTWVTVRMRWLSSVFWIATPAAASAGSKWLGPPTCTTTPLLKSANACACPASIPATSGIRTDTLATSTSLT